MLSLDGVLQLLNDKNYKIPERILKWHAVYYGMSLHIDGACPAFKDLRQGNDFWIYPKNYFGLAYQQIFEVFLLSRHPREPEATRQWRLSQYKPFTQIPFQKVIQTITGAIFQDSGYSIQLENKDDNEYIWGNNFDGKSLVGFIASRFQEICEDPNGFFAVVPSKPYYETYTEKVEPHVWFISSKYIRWVAPDEIIFEFNEYSWWVNSVGIFRFAKDGNGNHYNVDEAYGGYYAHSLMDIPKVQAGGVWNTQGFYDSWLNAAKPIADEYVGAKSAEQLVNKEASHPWIIEASEDCPECDNGQVQYCTTCSYPSERCSCSTPSYDLRSCNRCGGKGEISHNPGDHLIAPKEDMDRALIQVVTPDVGINKFHAENNKELYNQFMQALHLNYIEVAQSGVAKDKDMETRYQFILQISNDLFDRIIPTLIRYITGMRNVRVVNGEVAPYSESMVIVKPTQFQIKTSFDLLTEYKEAKTAQLPDHILTAISVDFTDKQFGGNDVLKRKTTVINEMDCLAVKTDADISLIALNNGVTQKEYQLHYKLPIILDEVIRNNGTEWFVKAPFEAIQEQANAIFTTKYYKPAIDLTPPDAEERVIV